jgi:hypothetical protein
MAETRGEYANPEDRSHRAHTLHTALSAARAKAAEEKDATAKKKGFKEYAPGFIHIDIKYLPRMPDEASRRYLFVAIDRASRPSLPAYPR